MDTVSGWWLDDSGQLYAMTPLGPGIVLDRDLPALLDRLTTEKDAPLLDALDGLLPGKPSASSCRMPIPPRRCA